VEARDNKIYSSTNSDSQRKETKTKSDKRKSPRETHPSPVQEQAPRETTTTKNLQSPNGMKLLHPKNVFYDYQIDFGKVVEPSLKKLFSKNLLNTLKNEDPNPSKFCLCIGDSILSSSALPVHPLPFTIICSYNGKDYQIAIVAIQAFRNPSLVNSINQQNPELFDPSLNHKYKKKTS